MDSRILNLIALVIEDCERPREPVRGHPPAETVRVLATLRQFLREGTPWRSLRAAQAKASGSTLRRRLEYWARSGVLASRHRKEVRFTFSSGMERESYAARAKGGALPRSGLKPSGPRLASALQR
jgi:transposase